MQIVKTNSARTKMKQWFKKERREENILRGRDMFESEFRRTQIPLSDLTDPEILPLILKKLAITSLDDMYASIGYGGMTSVRAVNRVRDEIIKARCKSIVRGEFDEAIRNTVLDTVTEKVFQRKMDAAIKDIVKSFLFSYQLNDFLRKDPEILEKVLSSAKSAVNDIVADKVEKYVSRKLEKVTDPQMISAIGTAIACAMHSGKE